MKIPILLLLKVPSNAINLSKEYNKNLEVLFWNKWFEIRTGISALDIKNKNLVDFYPNVDEKKLKRKNNTKDRRLIILMI